MEQLDGPQLSRFGHERRCPEDILTANDAKKRTKTKHANYFDFQNLLINIAMSQRLSLKDTWIERLNSENAYHKSC